MATTLDTLCWFGPSSPSFPSRSLLLVRPSVPSCTFHPRLSISDSRTSIEGAAGGDENRAISFGHNPTPTLGFRIGTKA